jgi:hypothetical protein
VAVLAALAYRAIQLGAADEQTDVVLAGHVGWTLEIRVATEHTHASAAVLVAAAKPAREAIRVPSADTARAAAAIARVEATRRAGRRVAVIATSHNDEGTRDTEGGLRDETSKANTNR